MRYGLSLFTSDRGIRPADAAKAAEANGFDAIYVPEHTHIPVSRASDHPGTRSADLPDDRYMRTLDPWVALSTAASVTSTIRLGTSVALPLEHDPITLAKTIASLDHLSDGRVVLGVGFGWNAEELADHGVPPNKRRTALREYLEAMGELWSQEEASYDGQFVKYRPSWAWPKPIQKPRPPILLGGGGTAKTFAWIAASADGWITTPIEQEIESNAALLRQVWSDAGRAGTPEITVLARTPDAAKIARWQEIGVTEVMFGLPDTSADEVSEYIEKLAATLDR